MASYELQRGHTVVELFWTIFGLALALCAAPGPITVETVRRGVQRGFRAALAIQAGAIVAELGWAVAVLWGVAPLVQHPTARVALAVAGTAVLFWMAAQGLRQAPPAQHGVAASTRSATLAGVMVAVTNPLIAMFWVGVAALLAARGFTVLQPAAWAVIGAAYVLGTLGWGIPLAATAAWSRRVMRPRIWRWWNIASGLALGGYGLQLLWSAL